VAPSANRFTDVVVVGSGPAGWAIADHCVRNALRTTLVAPRPTAPWPATYGVWTSQTGGLPPDSAIVRARRVLAGDRVLDREYAILDNEAVQAGYARLPVDVVAGTVTGMDHRHDRAAVVLSSGERLPCRLVVDASGPHRVLSGGRRRGTRPEQTAYGMVFPSAAVRQLVGEREAVFMRWSRETADDPTFLYAVPLPHDRVLVEETSLVRRPGLALTELRRRLLHRLERAGIPVDAATNTEHVRFAMDAPRPGTREADISFGVAAGMLHPATGYSVGESLSAAPLLARAIADALPRGRDAARRAARAQLWPYQARVVRCLRLWGQRTLLRLSPRQVPEFFDTFFSIPEHLQEAFLCGRDDLSRTVAAMAEVHRAAPASLRALMLTGALPRLPRLHPMG
jgi:lycopene beta-cyclase